MNEGAGSALIVGCGDVGLRVARRLRAQGREITGLVHSTQSAERLAAQGVIPVIADLDGATAIAARGRWPLLFWCAPPPPEGTVDVRLRRWLAQQKRPARIVYLSTSGVYGHCHGRWIDEAEPLKPGTERARRRLDAELALREWRVRSGGQVVTLRVPGIYGPGRLPAQRLQRGLPLPRREDSPYSNRIHVEDLAEATVQSATRAADGAVFNVSDGHPTRMTDYFLAVARLLDLPEPPQLPPEQALSALSPAMRSYLQESRRLCNRRLLEELGVVLRYPDLESGLPACVAIESGPRQTS